MRLNFININELNSKLSGVYIIVNSIDSRIYIGSTSCFKNRINEHKAKLKRNSHENIHLQRFYNKHGLKSLIFFINNIESKKEAFLKIEQNLLNINNELFNICKTVGKPTVSNRSFTLEDIKKIADMYNSGMSCSQISVTLFGNRSSRSKINLIVKGERYSEFKELFNYKQYSQKGKTRYRFRNFTDKDIEFINENKNTMSLRKLGEHVTSYNHRTIGEYINTL